MKLTSKIKKEHKSHKPLLSTSRYSTRKIISMEMQMVKAKYFKVVYSMQPRILISAKVNYLKTIDLLLTKVHL